MKRLLCIPGSFVPSHDTVTLITYKHLRQSSFDQIDVKALYFPYDVSLQEECQKDPCFKKFNIEILDNYTDVIAQEDRKNVISGIYKMFRYLRKCMKAANKVKYDAVYTSSIPAFTHLAGWWIKKKHKDIEWIASFSDPIYKSPYTDDLDSFKEYPWLLKIGFYVYVGIYMRPYYEKVAMVHADKLIFVSEEQRDFMIENYPQELQQSMHKRSQVIPLNYIEEWQMYKDLIELPKNKTQNKPLLFIHIGRIYGLRRVEQLLLALKELKEEDPDLSKKIRIEQYSQFLPRYQKLVKQYHLEDIVFWYDKILYGDVLKKMQKADVLLLFDSIIEGKQPYLPSKILDYLLVQKEILSICPENCPAHKILCKKGYICCENDAKDIKERIKELIIKIPDYHYSIEEYKNKRYF
jgi:glycosyltransferase involved in cell wall biosynthesis